MYLSDDFRFHNDFQYKKSLFLGQLSEAEVVNKYIDNLIGHGVSLHSRQSLLSAISEYNERNSLFKQNKLNELSGIRLANNKITKISTDKVYFLKSSYGDSSGIASYSDSRNTIIKALLEFYERQSMVFHWINKKAGKTIRHVDTENKYFILLDKAFDKILFSDISLFRGVHVILIICIGKHKAMGLGSGFELDDAIEDALREACETLPGVDPNEIKWVQREDSEIDINSNEYVFNKLSPKELLDRYEFLFQNAKGINYTSENKHQDYIDVVRSSEKQYQLEVVGISIPTSVQSLKEVKVISNSRGYTHMYPPRLKKEELSSYLTDKESLKSNYCLDPIPFP
ncbi:YcaO-like family protein [Lactiplantibacillus plantarum]|uniref:YcaO-like family protein n=1 Tax=Lactiplantibacillus plantarum TaxID=1590 RepID=UPI002D78E813|nr:YcaO-like family protein [Lactiplantibacillus plantarum]